MNVWVVNPRAKELSRPASHAGIQEEASEPVHEEIGADDLPSNFFAADSHISRKKLMISTRNS